MKIRTLSILFLLPSLAHADPRYHSIVLIGDRALGMGGAYTALSDDPSGIAYNPAGIAFGKGDNLSASVNLFFRKENTVTNYFGGNDLSRKTTEVIPSFVGGLHRLGWLNDGLVGAAAMYSSDYDFIDHAIDVPNGHIVSAGKQVPLSYRGRTKGYGRAFHVASALAQKLESSTSIGLSAEVVIFNSSTQNFQDIKWGPYDNAKVPELPIYRFHTRNDYSETKAVSLALRTGARHNLTSDLSLGFTVRGEQFLTQSRRLLMDSIDMVGKENGDIFEDGEVDLKKEDRMPSRTHFETNEKSPMGKRFGDVRGGIAWKPLQSTTTSADVAWYSASNGDNPNYDTIAIVNFAVGAEHYFVESFRMNAGFFLNNDSKKKSEGEHDPILDYKGYSLLASFVQGNTRYNLGAVYQTGTGISDNELSTGMDSRSRSDILSTAFSLSTAF